MTSIRVVRAGIVTAAAVTAVAVAALGCTALPGPSATSVAAQPSAAPVVGIDWGRVAAVERPANYEETVSPDYPGTHPILRIQGQATMSDVIARPNGGFVAVGYVPPDWLPVAWTSVDGDTWSIHPMGATSFTFPLSLAAGAEGTIVAVGRSGRDPVAWTTTDGVVWAEHTVAVLGDGAGDPERMTSAAASGRGFVAGGSAGPELFDRHARFWRSADGVAWQPVADDPVAFANAEVRALTGFQGGFVAVGVVGSVQEPTGSVAWTSPDGVRWARVDDLDFADGAAVSVVAAPFGGLVAVGSRIDRRSALAWVSPDGRSWTRTPGDPSLEYSAGFAWMTDAVGLGDLVVAVGDIQGLQRGTAMSWVSHDGLRWELSNRRPVQEQVELYAITPGGPGALAVGAFGAPDSYVPGVWVTPGR